MKKKLDKNGRELKVGQWVIPLATASDYRNQRIVYLTDEFQGVKLNEWILVDGENFQRLFIYKNGDTDYHSIEIYKDVEQKNEDHDWSDFNLNDYIKFKLTKKGEEYVKGLNKNHPIYSRCPLKFIESGVWYEDQIWHFSNLFGHTFYNGCDQLVETKIKLKNSL